MDAGRAAEALDAYDRAASVSWSPALDYNRGRALLAMGDFASALTAFEAFSGKAPPELLERTSRLPEVMAELRSKVSRLTLLCEACERSPEKGASRATVRGASVTPNAELRLNAGRADVVVSMFGYEPFAKTVELLPGASSVLVIHLVREAKTGFLRLEGLPSGAHITVDNGPERSLADPARERLELAPGPHELELSAPDHEPRHVSAMVERGRERVIPATLKRRAPSMTSRPWFWVAMSAVVTTALVVTIVATTQERGLDQGTLGTYRVP